MSCFTVGDYIEIPKGTKILDGSIGREDNKTNPNITTVKRRVKIRYIGTVKDFSSDWVEHLGDETIGLWNIKIFFRQQAIKSFGYFSKECEEYMEEQAQKYIDKVLVGWYNSKGSMSYALADDILSSKAPKQPVNKKVPVTTLTKPGSVWRVIKNIKVRGHRVLEDAYPENIRALYYRQNPPPALEEIELKVGDTLTVSGKTKMGHYKITPIKELGLFIETSIFKTHLENVSCPEQFVWKIWSNSQEKYVERMSYPYELMNKLGFNNSTEYRSYTEYLSYVDPNPQIDTYVTYSKKGKEWKNRFGPRGFMLSVTGYYKETNASIPEWMDYDGPFFDIPEDWEVRKVSKLTGEYEVETYREWLDKIWKLAPLVINYGSAFKNVYKQICEDDYYQGIMFIKNNKNNIFYERPISKNEVNEYCKILDNQMKIVKDNGVHGLAFAIKDLSTAVFFRVGFNGPYEINYIDLNDAKVLIGDEIKENSNGM